MWKTAFQFLGLAWLAFFLTGCGGENTSSPSYNPAIGPFDENGNYVEAWADNPPKKRWFKRNKDAEPDKPKRTSKAETKPKSKKKYRDRVFQGRKPKAKKKYRDRVFGDSKPTTKPKAEPKAKPKPVRSKPKPKPRTKPKTKQRTKPKAKPRTRPKPKAKRKPKPVKVKPKYRYHKVRKSDTLWGLSRRYGTTVAKIKKANGLRSNTIRTGSTLKIPR